MAFQNLLQVLKDLFWIGWKDFAFAQELQNGLDAKDESVETPFLKAEVDERVFSDVPWR